ncbi:thiamine phosphate synthase [Sphingosinicella sp. LHD-64]|uniref:thiamine phosphate synthase n=1 Tax=Sphingosinicella sp. LHD-64 TaxID=3072139 RepID=UPI00280DF47B|nr:thiamine phosphate synthase [Sphingosinicella sp. LHD-64]MDQ8757041.1 thiamine phosphate synthase [Sphingosinicella sp. LHD-64]
MSARQTLPRRWFMTDERLGDRLWQAIERLPQGAGIVFRHYSLDAAHRRSLFEKVRQKTRDRELLLLIAGPSEQAEMWGADGSHGRNSGAGIRSAPAHDLAEIRAAETAGADLVFLSPVFPTRSHPEAATLGPNRFAELAGQTQLPVIALGGMNEARFAALDGAYGWAGIDAWSGD